MRTNTWTVLALMTTALLVCGCARQAPPEVSNSDAEAHGHDHSGDLSDHAADDHSGWWCPEHGVPEEVCALCNSKIAAEFQKKGDWCKDHDRPMSQCFICKPELQAKFAAQYEAKYGKQPPAPRG
jgi:hypothetical protein